jgi:hypothetical protein
MPGRWKWPAPLYVSADENASPFHSSGITGIIASTTALPMSSLKSLLRRVVSKSSFHHPCSSVRVLSSMIQKKKVYAPIRVRKEKPCLSTCNKARGVSSPGRIRNIIRSIPSSHNQLDTHRKLTVRCTTSFIPTPNSFRIPQILVQMTLLCLA